MNTIKKIKEASYYIPAEFATYDKIKSAETIAYIRGITAGRQQAIDILLSATQTTYGVL